MTEHLEDLIADLMTEGSRLSDGELKGYHWLDEETGWWDLEKLEAGIRHLIWRTAVHVLAELTKAQAEGRQPS